jgi:glycosyltransferase involved in cell wall biosynthesis
VTRLLQFVPTLEAGAIGAHALELGRLCEEMGVDHAIYTEHDRMGRALDYRSYKGAAGDVLLYHVAIGSDVADFVRNRPEALVVDHHNITPASYFAAWEPPVVHGINWGRRQLAELADRCDLGVADSRFNQGELDDLGYRSTATAPILLDTSAFERQVDEAAVERLRHDGSVWLFVGRVAPHKAQHDVVKAFWAYRAAYDPKAQLRIVGGSSSPNYSDALWETVVALNLEDAVVLTGSVGDGELAAHYRTADVFVCLSDHEGFCVPLLEAMHHELPIVAFASSAVPETLDGAGLVLPAKRPGHVAAAVQRVLGDPSLRDALVATGRRRLGDFSLERTRLVWREALEPVLAR